VPVHCDQDCPDTGILRLNLKRPARLNFEGGPCPFDLENFQGVTRCIIADMAPNDRSCHVCGTAAASTGATVPVEIEYAIRPDQMVGKPLPESLIVKPTDAGAVLLHQAALCQDERASADSY
jgi:hypothetical protein